MWLQTIFGSFSINQTEADRSVGMLTISSHSRHDIDMFVSRFMPHGVVKYADKSADFQFFIRAPQANVAVTIAAAVSDIYYSDFIGAVQQTQGDLRTKCYYGVASQLSSIQYENNEYNPGNQVPEGIEPGKILEIGCEGGSFTIWRYPNRGERGFIVKAFDCSWDFLSKEDQIDLSKSLVKNNDLRKDSNNYLKQWGEAILELPESWAQMYPVYISEAYWPFISKELRLRGVEPTQEQVHDWLRALKESQTEGFEKYQANPKMTYKLEKAIRETRALLESVGQTLFEKEMLEVRSLVKKLGECEKHPTIEEFDTAHLGVNSIMYRLCDVMKGIAKEGHDALAAAECDITDPAIEQSMPNMMTMYDHSESERLKHELQTHQQQLLSIADRIWHFGSIDVCFLCCDLQVLIEHPEVAKVEDLVSALRAIQNHLDDIEERLEDMSEMIRQHKYGLLAICTESTGAIDR